MLHECLKSFLLGSTTDKATNNNAKAKPERHKEGRTPGCLQKVTRFERPQKCQAAGQTFKASCCLMGSEMVVRFWYVRRGRTDVQTDNNIFKHKTRVQ